MAFFGKNISTLFAICVTLFIAIADSMRTQQWTHDFGNSVFEQDKRSLTSPGQVFGNCVPKLVNVDKDKFKTFCRFAMENADAPIDSPDHVRMCNFTLIKDLFQNTKMYMLEEIIAIVKNRAVLRFEGHSLHIIWVLNFDNCTVANSYTNKNFVSVHAPTDKKFDLIVLKDKNPEQKYKITFDIDGKIISHEQPWFKSDTKIIAAVDFETEGQLIIDVTRRFVDHSLKFAVTVGGVADDGSVEYLGGYKIDERWYYAHRERFVQSTTFKLVSLCARFNSTTSIKCSQQDLFGSVKFDMEISLNEYSPVHSFRLHNLPRGGFLLFLLKCDAGEKPSCIFSDQSFYIRKINAGGEFVGSLKINDNNNGTFSKVGVIHIFESGENEVCLSNVRSKSYHHDLTLEIVCLKDDDFSGEIAWPSH